MVDVLVYCDARSLRLDRRMYILTTVFDRCCINGATMSRRWAWRRQGCRCSQDHSVKDKVLDQQEGQQHLQQQEAQEAGTASVPEWCEQ